MTLTTYSNRSSKELKEVYLWSLKRNRGMTALLALLMFLALPLILMVAMENFRNNTSTPFTADMWASSYTQYVTFLTSWLVTPLVLIFVLVLSASLFGYLHQKRSVDLFHSLPLGRTPMLLGRFLAELTSIFAPMLVNYAIISIVGACYGIDAKYSFFTVADSMLWLMLMSTAAVAFTVFMAVCTGTTLDMIISILGINVAYPLLIFATCTFASLLLPGLAVNLSLNSTVLTALSPFAAAILPFVNRMNRSGPDTFNIEKMGNGFLIWWVILTLVMIAASVFLYKKRKSECAESNFAFPIPKIVIRFIVTAVSGIGIGLLFEMATSAAGSFNFFIGVAAGSLAAHIVVEAVYSRGFKQMKRSFAWYGIFVAAFLVLYGVLATGFFGYDMRLPNAEDVESITVNVPNQYYSSDDKIYSENYRQTVATLTPVLKDKKNISQTLELHKEFLSANRSAAYPYTMQRDNGSLLTLDYHLKNGSVLKRSYSDSYSADRTEEIKGSFAAMSNGIGKMEEYIGTRDILFYLDPKNLKSIDINTGKNDSITVAPDETVKEELLAALKEDSLNGQVNNPNIEYEKQSGSIFITCKENIEPTGRVKELLGGYSGKICFGKNNYQLSDNAAKTYALIKKYAWNK